ncbi:MAG: SDR family oxidoreductase [Nitrospinaceae bacterium]
MRDTVLVTGAGTGIGKAIAQVLADRNHSLILLGRNRENLENTRGSLKNPENHKSFSCDIRHPEAIKKALQESGTDSLYAVVANAGLGGENRYGNGDRWQEIVDINLTGSYNTVQESLPYLKKSVRQCRKILFISSILARLGVPGYSAYCASKAGLLGLMRSLAAELARDKIQVNAICPGWVNTAMAHEGLQAFADTLNISREEAFKNAMSDVPLGKMSEPEEIARLVSFMLEERENSITGQTIDINNGAIMP